MIKKSIPAFVLGLIGGILGVIGGLCQSVCAAVGDAAASIGSGSVTANATTMVYVCFIAGSIIAIVGSCLCFKKALIGGILLAAAVVLGIVGIIMVGFNILSLIAMILIAVGALLAFLAKPANA